MNFNKDGAINTIERAFQTAREVGTEVESLNNCEFRLNGQTIRKVDQNGPYLMIQGDTEMCQLYRLNEDGTIGVPHSYDPSDRIDMMSLFAEPNYSPIPWVCARNAN